ncbi:MAG: hypothetical protein U0167_10595 [bacterium]
MARVSASRAVAALAALGLAGCITSPDQAPKPHDLPGYTDPSAFVQAYAASLQERNLANYRKLLADEFEYFPRAADLPIPWLDGDSWGYADELGMIGHMMDSAFVPKDPDCGAVRAMYAELTVSSRRDVGDGTIEVGTVGLIRVVWGADGGGVANARFVFDLARGEDGYLRLRAMHELPLFREGSLEVTPRTWAGLKAGYRE